MADKKQRIASIVGKDLSEIIMSMRPDLTSLASINEVELNYDNTLAKVYVTHLDPDKTNTLINYLNENKGIIRSKLAHELDIYKVPSLVFLKDNLYEEAHKIDSIIDSWHTKDSKK